MPAVRGETRIAAGIEDTMNRHRSVRWLVFAVLMLAFSTAAFSQVFISVRFGPPALPVYAQPICPGPGYFWTPGYWAWNDDAGYYWVPGTWVVAPVGMLWTPGYWGWYGSVYRWYPGYWGPHVGFYGGINYGFGYGGVGFAGGEWRSGAFFYNRSVTNVNVTNVTNVYNRTVIVNNTTVNRVSFNGGEGGIPTRPTPVEESAGREQHMAPLSAQTQHEHSASQNRDLFASNNHGAPKVAATTRAGEFSGHGVVKAQSAGGEYHKPAMSPREARGPSNESEARTQNNQKGSFTPPNSKGSSNNGGFKPFTPPNKNEGGNRSEGASNNKRELTPPNSNNHGGSNNSGYHESKSGGNNPLYESKDKSARPPESNPPRNNASSSRPEPHHDSAPKSNPPSKPQKQSAPPKHDNRDEHHRGR